MNNAGIEEIKRKIGELECENDRLKLELLNKNEQILTLEENLHFYRDLAQKKNFNDRYFKF